MEIYRNNIIIKRTLDKKCWFWSK